MSGPVKSVSESLVGAGLYRYADKQKYPIILLNAASYRLKAIFNTGLSK